MTGRNLPAILVITLVAAMAYALQADLNHPPPRYGEPQRQHQPDAAVEHHSAQSIQQPSNDLSLTQDTQNHHSIDPKAERESYWYAKPDWWLAGFTGALFLATAGLWIFTALLWHTTRRAVNDGEKALQAASSAAAAAAAQVIVTREIGEAQTRAYVSIKDAYIHFASEDGLPFVEIIATNSGQSPALQFVWSPTIYYFIDEGAIENDQWDEWESATGHDIHSAGEFNSVLVVHDFVFTHRILEFTDTVPDIVGVSITIKFTWKDVFGKIFKDMASFAGVAERGDAEANAQRSKYSTSAWFCPLTPIAKGEMWSGIGINMKTNQKDKNEEETDTP